MVRYWVITGPPGAEHHDVFGEVVRRREPSFYMVDDVVRNLLEKRRKTNPDYDPATDRLHFQRDVIRQQIAWETTVPAEVYASAKRKPGLPDHVRDVIVHRGIHENIAFCRANDVTLESDLLPLVESRAYDGVFFIERTHAFHPDDVAREDPAAAARVRDLILETYAGYHIPVFRLTEGTVEERAKNIMNAIKHAENIPSEIYAAASLHPGGIPLR